MNDSVASLMIKIDDSGTIIVRIATSLLIEVSLPVLANRAGIVAIGHLQKIGAVMFQVILVQKVPVMEMHQNNVFEFVGGNVTHIIVLEVAQKLVEGRIRGEKGGIMLVKVVDMMIKVELSDSLAKGAVASTAGNFGCRRICAWQRRNKSCTS